MDPQAPTPPAKPRTDEPTQSLARGTEATLPPTPPPDSEATQSWFKSPGAGNEPASKSFGDYELLARVGRGGMGVVYRARQRRLNRVVALKMIRSGEFAGDDEIARFYAEAEAAAQLDHPNIVPVFEVGQHDGQHFFSMGFIDGPTLGQRVSAGPLAPREAAELVREIAGGVQYAHERGVIHRDLKPQNILLASKGHSAVPSQPSSAGSWGSQPAAEHVPVIPKITDFGLAKRLQSDSSLTETGAVLGTPSYMPPEQAAGRGHEVGAASDVYSLGAILYCLLTGRPPFQAATVVDTVRQVLEQEPVAPRALVASIPLDIETITLKCLQKDPARRYASASALAEDLGRYLRGEPILARPVGRVERVVRWCNRNRMVASLISLTVLLLVSGTAISTTLAIYANYQKADAVKQKGIADVNNRVAQENARKWREQERLATQNATLATTAAEQAKQSAIAATESAAVARRNQYFADVNLAQQVLAAGDALQAIDLLDNHIPTPGNDDLRGFEWYYLWSLTHSSSVAVQWDSPATDPVRREVRVSCVSPDGKLLAVAGSSPRGGEVILYDATTRQELRSLPVHAAVVNSVGWSPDGQRLATSSGTFEKPAAVKVFDAAKGELVWEATLADPAMAVAWSPDGQWLAVGTAKLIQGRGSPRDRFFSTARGARAGGVQVLSAVDGSIVATLPGNTGHTFSLAFSPGSDTLAAGNERGEVQLFNIKTKEKVSEFRSSLRYIWSLDFAPSGDVLAAASGFWDEPGEVVLWNANSQHVEHRLRGHRGGATAVRFLPDGKSLASGSFDRTVRLWDLQTATELVVFYGNRGYAWGIDFADGGRTLLAADWRTAASSGAEAAGQVLAWDIAAGRSFTPLSPGSFHPGDYFHGAAAGDTVAFVHDQQIEIWDAPSASRRFSVRTSGQGPRTVDLSPNGRLVAAGGFAPTSRIWDTHLGTLIADLPTNTIPYLTFSPDGQFLATCGDDGVVRLFAAATGQALHTLTGHTDVVWSASFSPDGHRLASASWDGTVRLWDPKTGRALGTFPGHREALWQVSFLDSGRTLLTRSGRENLTIGIWDLRGVMPAADHAELPPPMSRDGLLISSYALRATALAQAGDNTKAKAAWQFVVALARRHLGSLPPIVNYSDNELSGVQRIVDQLLDMSQWDAADELCRLTDEACHRQLDAAPAPLPIEGLRAEGLIQWSRAAAGLGQSDAALSRLRSARQSLQRLAHANPTLSSFGQSLARAENSFAWSVARQEQSPRELIDEAVAVARTCTERSPKSGVYFNTLGVILVRAEKWDEAIAALQKSCELRSGGDAYDWYPLAIAFKRQGKLDEAKVWFDRAEAWRKEHPGDEPDLVQLRDEAAALLAPPANLK